MPILRVESNGLDRLNGGDMLPVSEAAAAALQVKRFFGLGRLRSASPPTPPARQSVTGVAEPGKYDHNGLMKHGRKVYSQGVEDGITEEIFRVIGARSKWCVEFGAWDGVFLSNTCNLIRNDGWSAVLIEGDSKKCDEIRANFPGNEKVHPLCAMVGFRPGVDTIDELLKGTPIPKDFDFISIDVDGVDWHIWQSIVEYRPRAVVIEFNPSIPNRVVFVQDRDMAINEGSSLAALVELGKEKGYELVAVTTANAFFVAAEEYAKFGIADNSPRAMRDDRPDYVFHGYNGKIYHTMKRLRWYGKNYEMQPDSLQFLTEFWNKGRPSRLLGAAANHLGEDGKPNLATADGILREICSLRSERPRMESAEFAERSKAVWAAAKAYMLTTPPEHVRPPSAVRSTDAD